MSHINNVNQLNERIIFSRSTGFDWDEGDNLVPSYPKKFYECWGQVRTLKTSESVDQFARDGELKGVITIVIRWNKELQKEVKAEGMYINYEGMLYNTVKYNSDSSRKEWDTVIAQEYKDRWNTEII